MQTKTYNVYTFDELSDDAKERAIYDFQVNDGWYWGGEWLKSLEAFCAEVGVTMRDYQIDYAEPYRNSFRFDIPDGENCPTKAELKKIATRFVNALPTGYIGDCTIGDTLRRELDGYSKDNGALYELVHSVAEDWGHAVARDYEDYYSETNIAELCDINEYMFTEDGRLD